MFKRLIAAGLLAGLVVAASSAFALPTADAVQAEVKQGHYAKAEIMMQEVVAAKPKSARAHYLYAEILAHNKAFDQAAAETAKARELDPAVSFTDPVKFNAFEQLLAREQQAARPKPSRALAPESALINNRPAALAEPSGGGTPGWVWVLGLAAVMAVIWALVSRRQQQQQRVPVGGMPMALQPGMGGAPAGYPQAPMGGGFGGMGGSSGPGLMGVGLAAAGGVAAGMLAEKLLHGGSNNPPSYGSAGNLASGNFDDAANNPAARELEQRDVDFGSGAGWDSGGSDNTGGGGDNSAGGSDDW